MDQKIPIVLPISIWKERILPLLSLLLKEYTTFGSKERMSSKIKTNDWVLILLSLSFSLPICATLCIWISLIDKIIIDHQTYECLEVEIAW